jgi:hypothetical protein
MVVTVKGSCQVLDTTWLRDVQDVRHTKFQKRKVVVRDQGRLSNNVIRIKVEQCPHRISFGPVGWGEEVV